MRRANSREELGNFDLVRSPINMSTFPMGEYFERSGLFLGEHTDEVLIEVGLNMEDISRLRQTGAI
jgi:crotonobetainyl-CoA:carnitine CoA-transferase CaiB-like acyl-CoA transferase